MLGATVFSNRMTILHRSHFDLPLCCDASGERPTRRHLYLTVARPPVGGGSARSTYTSAQGWAPRLDACPLHITGVLGGGPEKTRGERRVFIGNINHHSIVPLSHTVVGLLKDQAQDVEDVISHPPTSSSRFESA